MTLFDLIAELLLMTKEPKKPPVKAGDARPAPGPSVKRAKPDKAPRRSRKDVA